jgi:hypothetical protein
LGTLLPKQKSSSPEKQPEKPLPKYLNLSAATASPVQKTQVRELTLTEEYDTGLRTFDSWEAVIAWCMSLSRAEAGFVVDSQGFVIASRGRLPNQGVEGLGAELVCSIEQLERMDPESGRLLSVEMEFEKKRLLGFVANAGEQSNYVIGLISPESLNPTGKQAIIQQILHNLPNLD